MAKDPSTGRHSRWLSREYLRIFGPAILITVIGFVVAYQFVKPAPPEHITIGTGSEGGAYYPFGQRYREILARHGITLEVQSTAGSVENIKLLEANRRGVDVAFVQGGIGDRTASPDLTSLASLYFEPLWVFYRDDLSLARLADLQGRRIAVGMEGSGTKVVALQLLADNGITEKEASIRSIGGQEAVKALLREEIDAAFYVVSPRSSIVQSLLKTTDLKLMSFERAEAYTRVHPFLSSVKLPEGAINFESNIPVHDITLLAPAANLVAREDLHPALVDLLLQAATEVHGGAGLFKELNEFPSEKYLDFHLHKDARRYFRYGPPLLQRYLPFWAATLVDRLKVMLLPLITLLIPLLRIAPPGYRWRMRSRIFHWYKDLQTVDLKVLESQSSETFDACMTELERIEREVIQVSVPLTYAGELYSLRLHIAHVRRNLCTLMAKYRGEKREGPH